MIQYLHVLLALFMKFLLQNVTKIPRVESLEANKPSKYASIAISDPKKFDERGFVEYLLQRSIIAKEHEVLIIKQLHRKRVRLI